MKLPRLFVRLCFVAFIALLSVPAFCAVESREMATDSRIRVINYRPHEVFKYVGYYGYQGSIELEEDEAVETISMGDTVSWQIVPSGHRIFLKPIEQDATTNMTLITNKRTYLFELHAKEAKSIKDPGLAFVVKFLYPSQSGHIISTQRKQTPTGPDLKQYLKYNFNYTISGSNLISPIKIFDDGEFTYFEFKNQNAPLPAFFEIDGSGQESVVNYQVSGNYVVIESVAKEFVLRYGGEVLSVVNEKKAVES